MIKHPQYSEGYGTALKEPEMPLFQKALENIPHSANCDPVTSYEAADYLIKSGKMNKQLTKVYEALKLNDGATSAELAIFMNTERVLPARRLPDLKKLLLIENGKQRVCRKTGFKSLTWFIKVK